MKTVKAEQLAKHKGRFIAFHKAWGTDNVRYAKIVDVINSLHTLVLEPIGGDNEGEQVHTFYKIGDEVDVYDEAEIVVMVMKHS